ncbi:MAG TPA: pyridoxamine 5'-phosphate oxidase family protein [Thermodesulfovibrionales bacterium]|jgi:general stress protein 26|nr:pyridoxamine 5'-phosphate oxidase family protein [Thermodesulfovibrionales bacterium]
MERELSRHYIEKLIIKLLEECRLCVVATCSDNIPRASTVEFFPMGTTLYILTEGGMKIDNIKRNPRVSIALHAEFAGWSDVKGLQITGVAEIGEKGSRIFDEGSEAYKRRRGSQSTALSLPDVMKVIRVKPAKLEYLDATLAEAGHDVRHTLLL